MVVLVYQPINVVLCKEYLLLGMKTLIWSVSTELVSENEGCLSFPGLYVKIPRNSWIEVEYFTEEGKRIQTRLEGLSARCFLHELDHMNGIKLTQHVGPVALKMAKQKQEKRIKKHLRAKNK